jgi:hypothetical protein
MLNAERHYRSAQTAMTVGQLDAILEELTDDLGVKLDRIRVAIKFNTGVLAQHARMGQ